MTDWGTDHGTNRWKPWIASICRILAAVVLTTAAVNARAAAIDEAAVEALVRKSLAAWHVPGVAVAIVKDGNVVYLKGHGVRAVDHPDPVTPHTLFPIASCTKAFTTTAMALLADEGKMAWDDPVSKHLPYFHLADPKADKEVRLRDLVCHRTGLRGHDLLWYRSPWPPEEIVRRAGRLPLDKPFRQAFQYQSTMFTAAGLAVAAASGTPWHEFVRKRLLQPLGMDDVVFTTTDARRTPDYAFPHRLNDRGQAEIIAFYPIERPEPAGSIHASAHDLAKWLIFQLGDGTARRRRLVSAKNLDETHTPQIPIPMDRLDRAFFPETKRMDYAMGWVVQDRRGVTMLAHAGAIDGFRAQLTLVPEHKLGIVLLDNLHQTRMNIALSQALLDLLLGGPRRDWDAVVREAVRKEQTETDDERARRARSIPNTHPTLPLAGYVGTYEHPAYGTVRISQGPSGLVWEWNDFRAVLKHFHYDTFTLPIEIMHDPEVVFQLDGSIVTSMKVLGNMDVEFRRVRP
jgi:CubicO group peptidase (beta-lactamase class C family)